MSDVDLTTEEFAAADLAADAEPAAPAVEGRAPIARWYAVQVASSYEKKSRPPGAAGRPLGVDNRILESIPDPRGQTEERRQPDEHRRGVPGYVLVQMVLDEDDDGGAGTERDQLRG